jgi:hypothetical protein
MTSQWQPYREPLRIAMLRTGMIAIVVGAVLARWWGGMARWPMATLLVLWPSFGGHWVEIWFLNWLRPRLSIARGLHGCGSLWGVVRWWHRSRSWNGSDRNGATGVPAGALACLVARGTRLHRNELVTHLALQLRGRPSFYNGRG